MSVGRITARLAAVAALGAVSGCASSPPPAPVTARVDAAPLPGASARDLELLGRVTGGVYPSRFTATPLPPVTTQPTTRPEPKPWASVQVDNLPATDVPTLPPDQTRVLNGDGCRVELFTDGTERLVLNEGVSLTLVRGEDVRRVEAVFRSSSAVADPRHRALMDRSADVLFESIRGTSGLQQLAAAVVSCLRGTNADVGTDAATRAAVAEWSRKLLERGSLELRGFSRGRGAVKAVVTLTPEGRAAIAEALQSSAPAQ